MRTANPKRVYEGPILTTDIILEYDDGTKSGIVLVERKNPPYGLAMPGGFAERGLTLEENALKEIKEETGLDAVLLSEPNHPFCVRSSPDRDFRGHMATATYVGRGSGTLIGGDDALWAGIFTYDEIADLVRKKQLAFDHGEILGEYLKSRGYTL